MAASNGYANPAALVDTAWVAKHGADPTVRLIEVDVDTAAYATGHIAGAAGWNWQVDLQQRPARDIPTQQEWEALLARSGVSAGSTVVLYGDNNNWFAAFAYWLFKLYGHSDVKLMNGGRAKWIAEGRDVTIDEPSISATEYKATSPNLGRRAFRDDVAASIGDAAGLVDVRSPKEFSGELLAPENMPQEGAQRGGHVPGARNIPWATAVAEDGTFKSHAELAALYGGKGITPDHPTIAYCRIGERSAHSWFVLTELLGYPNVRNYDGSWTEWGSLIGAPIER
ncbi:MAG: sulfurtransferase [Pyrinomonadaceae bacterium]